MTEMACVDGFCRGKAFALSPAQETKVADARRSGLEFVLVVCPRCKCPSELILKGEGHAEESHVPCPVSGCGGVVSKLSPEGMVRVAPGGEYWGCGECGRVWSNVDDPQFEDLGELVPGRSIKDKPKRGKRSTQRSKDGAAGGRTDPPAAAKGAARQGDVNAMLQLGQADAPDSEEWLRKAVSADDKHSWMLGRFLATHTDATRHSEGQKVLFEGARRHAMSMALEELLALAGKNPPDPDAPSFSAILAMAREVASREGPLERAALQRVLMVVPQLRRRALDDPLVGEERLLDQRLAEHRDDLAEIGLPGREALEAFSLAEAALDKDPDDGLATLRLGHAYLARALTTGGRYGDLQIGVALLKRVHKTNNTSVPLLLDLASGYTALVMVGGPVGVDVDPRREANRLLTRAATLSNGPEVAARQAALTPRLAEAP